MKEAVASKKLILISDPDPVPGEAAIINRLFEEGLALFHLRKPGYTEEEVHHLLHAVRPEFHEKIVLPFSIVHNKRSLFKECRNIHFFEQLRKNTKAEYFETLSNKGYTLSTSLHEAEAVSALPGVFAYAFLGPVFDSISKPGHAAMDTRQWSLLKQERKMDIIALGGIDEENCNQALDYGFDGVAVLGAVWKSKDPVEKFKRISACLTKDR